VPADIPDVAADGSQPFDILFVCLGNVCRSPLAEHLLRRRLDELLGGGVSRVRVSSAGVRALVGEPMNELAEAELRRLGGDPGSFRAHQLTAVAANGADLVLTATRALRSRVLEEAPRALKRTFTIRELAALLRSDVFTEHRVGSTADLVTRAASWRGSVTVDEYDIPDPIGRTPEVHREVADILDDDCDVIARAVTGAVLSDAGTP
jgi:protein-tyrosine phosphatase